MQYGMQYSTDQRSLFLVLGFLCRIALIALLSLLPVLPPGLLLLVLRGRLLLTAQLGIPTRLTLILVIIIVLLLRLEVLVLALVLIGNVDNLGSLGRLHDHLHSPRLEVLDQGVQFRPLHAQELNHLFLLTQGELDVELLVAGVDAVELDDLDVLHPEVEDGLGDEDQRVFQHVQPPRLRLHVRLHARLPRLRLEVVPRLDQIDAARRIQQLHQDLKLRARVFRLQLTQLGIILHGFGRNLGLKIDLDFLLDLDDDVAVDGLPLVDGLVLVELQDDGDLTLVGHGQDEAASDVLVLDRVVEGHAVESDALLVEVHRVLPARHRQVHVQESGQRLARELADLRPLDDLLVDRLGRALLLPLPFLALPLHLHLVLVALLLGLLDVEADLAHAVLVTDLVGGSLDDDVLLVDGGVVDRGVVDRQDGVLAGHRDQGQRGSVPRDTAVVHALE